MISPTYQKSLAALRQAGSVFGLVFLKGEECLFRDTPYAEKTLDDFVATLDDICRYLAQEGRSPDQLAFGYDGGNVLVLLSGEFRLVAFHHRSDELDFIARAARSLMKDFEMSQLAAEWVAGGGRGVPPTAPISPIGPIS